MSFRHLMKKWYAPEAIPLYAVMGFALAGATWYTWHLATGPTVVWDRTGNPEPWNNIKQGDQVKLVSIGKTYDRHWQRNPKKEAEEKEH